MGGKQTIVNYIRKKEIERIERIEDLIMQLCQALNLPEPTMNTFSNYKINIIKSMDGSNDLVATKFYHKGALVWTGREVV